MDRPTINMRPEWLYSDPEPLHPLGDSTDSYAFTNGVMAWYSPGFMYITNGVDQAIAIPSKLFAVIKAVAVASGLTDDQAIQLADAAERYAR
jgi:hypothetical protein